MGKDTNETPSAPFRLKATHYFRLKGRPFNGDPLRKQIEASARNQINRPLHTADVWGKN